MEMTCRRRWFLSIAMVALLADCASRLEVALQKAIAAHDLAAVRQLLLEARQQNEPIGHEVYRTALESVETFVPASVEILRLVLEANPQRRSINGGPQPKPADATFSSRRPNSRATLSAVEIVTMKRSGEAVRVLLDAGLTVPSDGAHNALVYAIWNRIDGVPELLIAAGADVNAKGRLGPTYTPLEAAREVEDQRMIDYLRSKGAR